MTSAARPVTRSISFVWIPTTPTVSDRKIGGEVYRTGDAGHTWQKVSAQADDVSRKAGYSFNQLRVDPNNPDRVRSEDRRRSVPHRRCRPHLAESERAGR